MSPLKLIFGDRSNILYDHNLQTLLLANVNVLLGLALVSPLLDSLVEPFGVTDSSIGLMVTLYTAPGIIMIPIAGALADRFGRKPILITGLLLFGVPGTAIALTSNFTVILGLRLLQGAGYAFLFPIIITSIGDLYTGAEESTAQGFRLAASGVGNTIFPILGGVLIIFGWQYPFLMYSAAIPTALLVYLRFTESQKSEIDGEDTPNDSRKVYLRNLFQLVVAERLIIVLIALATAVFLFIAFLTFNSFVVRELLGGTPQQAGLLVATCSLSYAMTATQVGRLVARCGGRVTPLVAANVCYGGGFLLLAFAPSFLVAEFAVVGIGIGFGVTGTLYRSIITETASEILRGGLVSLGETGGRIAATISPISIGLVIDYGRPLIGIEGILQTVLIALGLLGGGIGILSALLLR